MFQFLAPYRLLKVTAALALATGLAACTNAHKAQTTAPRRVNLSIGLSAPEIRVHGSSKLILCPDAVWNSHTNASTPGATVHLFISNHPQGITGKRPLLTYGTGQTSRNVPSVSHDRPYGRPVGSSYYQMPVPEPTGRHYIIGEVRTNGDIDENYLNNTTSVAIDF